MVEPLLSEREAAAVLGVAAKTLSNWRSIGSGPTFVRVGGRILYEPRDLSAFIESKKFRANGVPASASAT